MGTQTLIFLRIIKLLSYSVDFFQIDQQHKYWPKLIRMSKQFWSCLNTESYWSLRVKELRELISDGEKH